MVGGATIYARPPPKTYIFHFFASKLAFCLGKTTCSAYTGRKCWYFVCFGLIRMFFDASHRLPLPLLNNDMDNTSNYNMNINDMNINSTHDGSIVSFINDHSNDKSIVNFINNSTSDNDSDSDSNGVILIIHCGSLICIGFLIENNKYLLVLIFVIISNGKYSICIDSQYSL